MSTKYEYSSYSSSSKGGADKEGLFEQIDADGDGVIDRDELASYVGGSGSKRTAVYGSTSYGRGGRVYESSGYSSGLGLESVGRGGSYQVSTYESTSTGLDAAAFQQAASYTAESNASWSRYGAEVRGVGLYVDPNPEIIRREIGGGVQTYTQNIRIRFLQPPAVATSGALIIKEVRAAQPPPLPPLRIKQHEVAVAALPPLILRERPPNPPPVLPTETQIRHIAAVPVPPRSVIIERYPALPPPPRDIIIERWLPYNTVSERKTIVQRAEAFAGYAAAHNVIIEYQRPSVRIVRNFQQLGITQENPQAYIARYGSTLLDSHTLVHEARAAGVLEDISVPATTTHLKSLTYSSDSSLIAGGESSIITGSSSGLIGTGGYETSYVREGGVVGTGLVGTGYETTYVREGGVVGTGLVGTGGYESTYVGDGVVTEGGGSGYSATYESSSTSYSTGGGVSSTGFSSTEAKL